MTLCFANQLIKWNILHVIHFVNIYFLFNQRIPQRSTGITHNDPWILDESDSSDDEEVALALISKDVERQIILANGLHINYPLGFLECACRLYICIGYHMRDEVISVLSFYRSVISVLSLSLRYHILSLVRCAHSLQNMIS